MEHILAFGAGPKPDWAESYISLADEVFTRRLSPAALSGAVANLPVLNHSHLEMLGHLAEKAGDLQPRYGWAIATVAYVAAMERADNMFLQALAAWYVGRAANKWGRPKLATRKLSQARIGFTAVNRADWVAACDWQVNALPWTRPNFEQAARELNQALAKLEGTELIRFASSCRLSLAFSQLLTADFKNALQNVVISEATFTHNGDRLNVGRCWLTRSSVLRRQDSFEEAMSYLNLALDLFNRLSVPIEVAKVRYQLALCQLFFENDYQSAEENLALATETFTSCDLPLWVALCEHVLGQIYLDSGRLVAAGNALANSSKTLEHHRTVGALGDVLFDKAKYERLAGNLQGSMADLQRAARLYAQVGAPLMSALATMHQGTTFGEWGRYELALSHLERAKTQLQELGNPGRLAECNIRLALVWLDLNEAKQANTFLEKALAYYERAHRPAYLATVYRCRADAARQQQDYEAAIAYSRKAMTVSERNDLQLQSMFTHRTLGELLCVSGEIQAGLEHLRTAISEFSIRGMVFEQADCLVVLANALVQLERIDEARLALQRAEDISEGMVPAIIVHTSTALAELAVKEKNISEAIAYYSRAMSALGRQRRDFWLPDLAGSYLRDISPSLDRAVLLAAQNDANNEALMFLETSKAQTLARRLAHDISDSLTATPPPELTSVTMEIRHLYERIYSEYSPTRLIQPTEVAELIQQLPAKVKTYHTLRSRWERERLNNDPAPTLTDGFDVRHFRQLAQENLGVSWMAVNYFLTDSHLCAVMLTADTCYTWQRPISRRISTALEICGRARKSEYKPQLDDLTLLGNLLFPKEVTQRLTPDTVLLLAPHRSLHQLPWPALICGKFERPLVTACVPVVVPSLFVLSLLWQRDTGPASLRGGLVIGVSRFPRSGLNSIDLVSDEVANLSTHLGSGSHVLENEAATWDEIRGLATRHGLARFSFCHIATHIEHDPVTGRLSCIILHDQDVWADQLWECAPWPRLVMLSGCSGGRSFLHKGDEHMGLASTFLAAGVQTIIGSLWRIRDKEAINLPADFYTHLFTGTSPARALALAQRRAFNEGRELSSWGSFLSVGQP